MKQNVTNDAWKDSPIDIIAPILPLLSFQPPRSQGSLLPMMATTGNAEVTYASVNSTCAQPPPGNCGAFARLVSPGGGAFANVVLPGGGWAQVELTDA